jgi:hypothetical protein
MELEGVGRPREIGEKRDIHTLNGMRFEQ